MKIKPEVQIPDGEGCDFQGNICRFLVADIFCMLFKESPADHRKKCGGCRNLIIDTLSKNFK